MNIRTRIVKVTAALTLSAAAIGIGTMSPANAGDPSQWGREQSSVSVERKVNEYEGQQHRHLNEYEGQKVNEYEGQHR
jgi:hypothetical protein